MSNVWRIFVIEGDEALNRSLVNSLRKDGFVVQGATNGTDAVRMLWAEEYDVAICDLNAPGANGFEVLQWQRANRPNMRAIIIGAAVAPELHMQLLESGAASFLEKPLDLRLLKEELRRLLQQTGFSASLDSFDLLDVIQIINMSRKSITLLVNTGLEERGILRFHNGEMIWAEYGLLRGEEAFFALAAHKNGTVIHQPWNEQVVANVTQPLSRLILQALQYRTKYANMSQVSGEHEVVTSAPFSLDEIDDTPFGFLPEAEAQPSAASQSSASLPIQQPTGLPPAQLSASLPQLSPAASPYPMQPSASLPIQQPTGQLSMQPGQPSAALPRVSSPLPQASRDDPMPVTSNRDSTAPRNTDDIQEWWERTGQITSVKPKREAPGSSEAVPDEYSPANTSIPSSHPEMSLAEYQSPPTYRTDLPSWLTDQPTAAELPLVRPQSTTITARIPTTPVPGTSSPEWQPTSASKTTDPLTPGQPTAAQRASMLEARTPAPVIQEWQSQEPTGKRATLSGAASKRAGSAELDEVQESSPPSSSTAAMRAQRAAKRNYPALVSALRTLGESTRGFIAAAVVNVDGHPIAQVAIEDLDIAGVCKPFSLLLRDALEAMEEGGLGNYEHLVVTGSQHRVLMRLIGTERTAFQVLVTTHEADAAESLEMMANVEGALSASLR